MVVPKAQAIMRSIGEREAAGGIGLVAPKPLSKVTHTSVLGTIRLRYEKDAGTLTYVQRGGNQSAVDRHGISLDTYIHAIYGLVLQTPAKNVLMIGCGGGTLGKMLSAIGKRVTIVDIDSASFRLAKHHFGLPANITCRVGDGLAYMQKTRRRFDTVVIDAFVGETIPPHLAGGAMAAAARRCLRRGGSLFVNVCLDNRADRAADIIGHHLKENGWSVRLLDQAGSARNAVVAAGDVRKLRPPVLIHPPNVEVPRVKIELRHMRFRRLRDKGA
ncbi:MAG: methyltransferase domain-containing protein [Rhodospirillaceae bacterium]|nr:methyltransferase domain-containing protein [Rhodospirillaceae bacterium]